MYITSLESFMLHLLLLFAAGIFYESHAKVFCYMTIINVPKHIFHFHIHKNKQKRRKYEENK